MSRRAKAAMDEGATTNDAPSQRRCPSCGRRAARADPGCPVHGPLVAIAAGDRASFLPEQHRSPVFPGYETRGILGRGSFATLFAAVREDDRRTTAIKLAHHGDATAGRRLLEEMTALRGIGPPHVPMLHDFGRLDDGSLYLVMAHVDAPTLADRLVVRPEPIPLAEAAALATALLEGIGAVHARGFVHRDLKPENVLIDEAGHVTLVDFGLVTSATRETDLTAEGMIAGTPEYMSPEQCAGLAAIDERSDLYAFGVILHEMLTGRPPFWGAPALVRQSHIDRRPPRLVEAAAVPPQIEAIILRCLAKDPADRFASAATLSEALSAAFASATAPDVGSRSADADDPGPLSAASRSEQRRVGLLFFETDTDVVAVRQQLASVGGQLAYASGRRYAGVYGHDVGENPARRAMRGGAELCRRGLCARALVDLADVSVRTRRDGSRRFLSLLFGRDDRYPSADDPLGVCLTEPVAALLPRALSLPLSSGRARLLRGSIPPVSDNDDDAEWMIGRDALLDALLGEASRVAAGGPPTVSAIVGDAGNGKSHLARALRARLRAIDPRAQVIELRGRDPATGVVDHTLRELLQRALALPAARPTDDALSASAAEIEPAVAFALGWLSADAPELKPLRTAPGALRSALTAAAGEALRQRAARGPLFVVLDDAQYAEEATLAALEYAALAEAKAPLWICAFGRPAFEAAHPSWGERAGRRALHPLGPLDAESAEALCRRLLLPAENVPLAALQRLVARAQAVPLLLVELTRGLMREGIVRRHPRGNAWYLATDELDNLPDDLPLLEWLAHAEVDALAPALRAHARLIALLGVDVTIAEIEGVLRRLDLQGEESDLPLVASIGTQRLLTAGVLGRDRNGRVGFRHVLVREAVARATPASLRARIHRATFEFYRDAIGVGEERRLGQIAHHAAAAGLGSIAEAAYFTLAERARAKNAYADAERLYSRAIEASAAPPPAAYRGRGRMRCRLGRYHDALSDLIIAREAASARGDTAAEIELLLDEVMALDWMEDYARAEELVMRARTLTARATSPTIEASLDLAMGRAYHRRSQRREAVTLFESAVAKAELLGDEGHETLVVALRMLGFILPALGRGADAGAALDRAIALCEAHGDKLHLASCLSNRSLLRAAAGDQAGVLADLERSLVLTRELGEITLEQMGQRFARLRDETGAILDAAIRARR